MSGPMYEAHSSVGRVFVELYDEDTQAALWINVDNLASFAAPANPEVTGSTVTLTSGTYYNVRESAPEIADLLARVLAGSAGKRGDGDG